MSRPPGDPEKARRALLRRQPLLAAWLDAMNRFDHPMRRRVAHFREQSHLRREIEAIRDPRMRDITSDLTAPPSGRPHS